ncbi:Lactose permease [Fulvia fulva]|uniref:Lactose permease n=1 Tax=Passalora fulva TaxID=5499 RepID=A0A9Q8PKA3_PASFU|nr:Lactose permease [Fulvia fulva]KAK4611587.1 Lactose permease [Fulvia fulva]UJO24001.1 Lactose permease [Fulvia fulva]WPV21561.1 Lactose permease [Fulvia fulva]WPV36199.1 Lactose permease [Fulvia fulva]
MEPVTKSSLAGQSKEGATFISHIEDTTGDAKQIPEVVNVQGNPDFIQATTNGAPLNLLSKESLQLYLILLTACLNATASGFDGSIFGSINAMNQYQAYFRKEETGSSTGIIFAIYTIGSMVGAVFTGFVCDVFGRRAGMGIGAVIIMIGAVLIRGRFVLGLGISLGTSAAPTYAIELAPLQWRGRITGYYNTFFYSGSILATGVTYATTKDTSQLSWRLPLGLQCVPPVFILLGSFSIPESPRWLCSRGKHEEAARILAKYHGAGDMRHPMVQLELREFEESIAVQKMRSWWDWRDLVKTHNACWRIAMVALMSYGSQLSGNSVLTYYLPTMYTQLGVASTDRRLLLTFANSIVSCTGAVFGSATNDKIGRRTKLWVGSFVLAILFAAVTGFSSYFEHSRAPTSHAKSLSNAGIAFIFLFGCAYSFVYTPLTPTYCAETLDNHTRATGMGIHVIMNNTANFYNTYITAVAFKAIAWKYYLVFVCLNVVYGFAWYFCGMETKGRTMEQLQEVFDAPWPPKASLQKTRSRGLQCE